MRNYLITIVLLLLVSCSEDSVTPEIEKVNIDVDIHSYTNNEINTPTTYQIIWQNKTEYNYVDKNYKVYIGKDSTLLKYTGISRAEKFTFKDLHYGTKYYWQLELYDGEELLGKSGIYWFETIGHYRYKYVVNPPEGYLPYPNHNPEFDSYQYAKMEKDISIINNFGLYQGNSDGSFIYYHDGLDFVYPNDTKIYSLTEGIVVHKNEENEYYYSFTIKDLYNPEYGWEYVHIDSIQHNLGDTIKAGEYICQINFRGLDHLHLNRVRKSANVYWGDYNNTVYQNPYKHFKFEDNEPPTFFKSLFYFQNNSNETALSSDSTISGKVDLVIGLRDGGEYAHLKGEATFGNPNIEGFGDRLAVAKIEYSFHFDGKLIEERKSIDLTNTEIIRSAHDPKLIYKHWTLFDDTPESGDKKISFYIITNNYGNTVLDNGDSDLCWDTTEKNSDGTPKYPNGTYTIKVKAFDGNGNKSEIESKIQVKNE